MTQVGSTSYAYDANGNMTTRGSQTLTWDVENQLTSVTDGTNTSSFVYDGDGNRVKKTEGGQTIIYVNQYYEKNETTGVITTYYYLGSKMIAVRQGTTLNYIQQDSLSSTSVVSDTSGNSVATVRYFPFGLTRSSSGTLPTDKEFTGQRLDETGLYYYGGRYYDPSIGRFISLDNFAQSTNPQTLNRYTYSLNNPLIYMDPTGWATISINFHWSIGAVLLKGGGVTITFGFNGMHPVDWQVSKVQDTGLISGGTISAGISLQVTNANAAKEIPNPTYISGAGGEFLGGATVEQVSSQNNPTFHGTNIGIDAGFGGGVYSTQENSEPSLGGSFSQSNLPSSNNPVTTASPSPPNPPNTISQGTSDQSISGSQSVISTQVTSTSQSQTTTSDYSNVVTGSGSYSLVQGVGYSYSYSSPYVSAYYYPGSDPVYYYI